MRPDLTRIVDAFQNDIIQFAQKLIQTPSLPGQEQSIADLVLAEMERLGYDQVWRDHVGNVVGLMKGTEGDRSLMLNSHMDHVDVGDAAQWPHPPYSAALADGFIWGRAACDGKGALAVQVYAPAMARKAGRPLPRSLYTTATVLEERGGWGTAHLVKHIKSDCAVLGQASRNELRSGHRGRMELIVTFRGRSVHASIPARGANPHFAMARFLGKLRELRMVSDAVLGHSTVAPTLVTTDQTSPNVTPGEIRLTLDWRNIPSETPAQVVAKMQKVLDDCSDSGVTGAVEIQQTRLTTYMGHDELHLIMHPGYHLPDDAPLLERARQILTGALEREVELAAWSFATDGGHLMAAGIPTVGFGPGEESFAHTTHDRVAIAQLRESAVGYLALLEHLK
ncbi:MAG: M20/M25/M40 family metallo-hydrolase [Chloroflexi bacterium]|nr:M20/M25/M40 family metallo-hydrolase [Chloroflexota bacterium]